MTDLDAAWRTDLWPAGWRCLVEPSVEHKFYNLGMGSNRRYPDLANRLAEERELRDALRHGALRSLSSVQVGLERSPVTFAPERGVIKGVAWLQFGDVDVPATVRVDRWTDRAVGVTFEIDGKPMRCWVWRGAVRIERAGQGT